jgi:hypothetical protein
LSTIVAALYVETNGVYFGLDGVEPYDEARDAFTYRGPRPAIVHSPCDRWGRYWSGGPSANERRLKGDDGGAFAHGLWVTRTFGGLMEHPEASHAWVWFGLSRPNPLGGWRPCDSFGGWTCQVEQGHYGHRARKKTWLYAVGVDLPELRWGPSTGERLDEGFHSAEERRAARAAGVIPRPRLSTAENLATPLEFAMTLVSMARSVRARSAA